MRGGFLQSGGGDECPSLGHLAGHGRERERGALMVEVGGSCVERKIGILENWKIMWLVEEGRDLKKKEKGKEIKREDIFSWTQNETVESTDFRV